MKKVGQKMSEPQDERINTSKKQLLECQFSNNQQTGISRILK